MSIKGGEGVGGMGAVGGQPPATPGGNVTSTLLIGPRLPDQTQAPSPGGLTIDDWYDIAGRKRKFTPPPPPPAPPKAVPPKTPPKSGATPSPSP